MSVCAKFQLSSLAGLEVAEKFGVGGGVGNKGLLCLTPMKLL